MKISLRLPKDISDRLTALERRTGRGVTQFIVEAIREHLDDLEDLYLAESSLKEIRDGKAETVALEDVMIRYGMEV
jgi:RHH-type transcriptional regulator, rel operon repressor / antitoxin RelB